MKFERFAAVKEMPEGRLAVRLSRHQRPVILTNEGTYADLEDMLTDAIRRAYKLVMNHTTQKYKQIDELTLETYGISPYPCDRVEYIVLIDSPILTEF